MGNRWHQRWEWFSSRYYQFRRCCWNWRYNCCYRGGDIFADQGLSVPTYWEELLAVCDKFKAAGIVPVTWELATTVNCTFASWEFFGAVIGKDSIPQAQRIYKGEGTFAKWPAFMKAVDRMMLFAKREYIPPDAQGMNFEAALQYFATKMGAFI